MFIMEPLRRRKLLMILSGILLILLPAQSEAVRFDGVLPNGAGINKAVRSIQSAKFEHIVRQQTDFSCGAAAVATLLQYAYRMNLSEADVMAGMLALGDETLIREKGFSLLNIKHYAQQLGLRGRGYRIAADQLAKVKIPTIILLDIKGYKHFVVLKKVTDDDVYIADPALGNLILTHETFLSQWNNILFAIVGQGFDKHNVLLSPAARLTARKLLSVHAPIQDAELLEYGFRRSELF